MDNLRGNFELGGQDGTDYDPSEDERVDATPPAVIGTDERRMQVRAYNHWAGLLEDRAFPSIEDLDPESLDDFGPHSVLLDFSGGVENPGISYLGRELASECDVDPDDLTALDDVPSRSLLSRITDHYMQILANQAPIGFEAEFVNQRGATILYRGILLPYSSDDDTIDFIYGVINWKELADAATSEELLLEIDQALEDSPLRKKGEDLSTDWADGPAAPVANHAANDADGEHDIAAVDEGFDESVSLPAADVPAATPEAEDDGLPAPSFGATLGRLTGSGDDGDEDDLEDEEEGDSYSGMGRFASLVRPAGGADAPKKASAIPSAYEPGEDAWIDSEEGTAPNDLGADVSADEGAGEGASKDAYDTPEAGAADEPATGATIIELPVASEGDMELGDWLAAARECAAEARSSEDRTRSALYEAVGRAYDFSLAAAEEPEDFAELVADSGLAVQDRAPMTPVVKLVFGADYDKTRLTEYAAVLSHAHRLEMPRGKLADFLREADGGLKGVVQAERRLRREESGETALTADEAREALFEQLRAMPPQGFDALDGEGEEFALLMVRRLEDGRVVLLGEVPEDAALVERAARKIAG
ncbi:hypothetical protein [Paraurantiacibacter namhicola]|uniref:Uncharacterized protein n=1 Tax=Paraurantiacibacter namhicola TaxID=645517 RepID=A0A1C7D5U1_9SPHN|nr:hypothetical protein A6F65_00499 [Paraurantiacibacter namhicola]